MDTINELTLVLRRARVIHANKYSETSGGIFNSPVYSTLYTDVVFRLHDTNEDYKVYISGLDLPLYTEQEVTLVCVDRAVVAFIDSQTKYYYYTSDDYSRLLGFGVSYWWLVATLVLVVVSFSLVNDRQVSTWLLLIVPVLYVFIRVHRWILNQRIKKAITAFLE